MTCTVAGIVRQAMLTATMARDRKLRASMRPVRLTATITRCL